MSRIRKGGGSESYPQGVSDSESTSTTETPDSPAATTKTQAKTQAKESPGSSKSAAKSVDQFALGTSKKVDSQLQAQLQALTPHGPSQKTPLTAQELEHLVSAFVTIVKEYPDADRRQRAKLFAAAILKRQRLKKLFKGLTEEKFTEMCSLIGGLIESSPEIADLIDVVTMESQRQNVG